MTRITEDTQEMAERAREVLAQAHEPRKYLVAVDIRNGNIGRQGVMWVETETALKAIASALEASQLAGVVGERDALRAALEQIAETPNAGWMIARAALNHGASL